MSWLLIAIGVSYGLYRGKSAFGVDFLGGDTTTFAFQQRVDEAQVRSGLAKADVKDPLIQYQKDLSTGKETLRVDSATGTGDKVRTVLLDMSAAKFRLLSQDGIGATVGQAIQKSAVIASLL